MTEENYRPRSPDFSSLPIPSNPTQSYAPLSPLAHRASYDASPFFSQHRPSQSRIPQQYVPPYQLGYDDEMARRSSRLQAENAPVPDPVAPLPAVAPPMPDETPQARPGAGIEVKTKFPVARIKRIMQADEDVGKVAQATPIAVCMYILARLSPFQNTNLCHSQSFGALHDLSRHQGCAGSQGSQLEARHRVPPETRSCQGRGARFPRRYHCQGARPTSRPEARR